jgi:hypothetical protein
VDEKGQLLTEKLGKNNSHHVGRGGYWQAAVHSQVAAGYELPDRIAGEYAHNVEKYQGRYPEWQGLAIETWLYEAARVWLFDRLVQRSGKVEDRRAIYRSAQQEYCDWLTKVEPVKARLCLARNNRELGDKLKKEGIELGEAHQAGQDSMVDAILRPILGDEGMEKLVAVHPLTTVAELIRKGRVIVDRLAEAARAGVDYLITFLTALRRRGDAPEMPAPVAATTPLASGPRPFVFDEAAERLIRLGAQPTWLASLELAGVRSGQRYDPEPLNVQAICEAVEVGLRGGLPTQWAVDLVARHENGAKAAADRRLSEQQAREAALGGADVVQKPAPAPVTQPVQETPAPATHERARKGLRATGQITPAAYLRAGFLAVLPGFGDKAKPENQVALEKLVAAGADPARVKRLKEATNFLLRDLPEVVLQDLKVPYSEEEVQRAIDEEIPLPEIRL